VKHTTIESGATQPFDVTISRLPLQPGQFVTLTIDIYSYGRWIWWNWFNWFSWCWRRELPPISISRQTLTWTYGGSLTQTFQLTADTNDAKGGRKWEMYFDIPSSSSSSSAYRDYR
jgi:hypothetical protein